MRSWREYRRRQAAGRALSLFKPKDCSICGAVYSGDHCPNCGWFAVLAGLVSIGH